MALMEPGTIVLAQPFGHNYKWPAQIIPVACAPQQIKEMARDPEAVLVIYFGDATWGWCLPSAISRWSKSEATAEASAKKLPKGVTVASLKRAIEEAEQVLATRAGKTAATRYKSVLDYFDRSTWRWDMPPPITLPPPLEPDAAKNVTGQAALNWLREVASGCRLPEACHEASLCWDLCWSRRTLLAPTLEKALAQKRGWSKIPKPAQVQGQQPTTPAAGSQAQAGVDVLAEQHPTAGAQEQGQGEGVEEAKEGKDGEEGLGMRCEYGKGTPPDADDSRSKEGSAGKAATKPAAAATATAASGSKGTAGSRSADEGGSALKPNKSAPEATPSAAAVPAAAPSKQPTSAWCGGVALGSAEARALLKRADMGRLATQQPQPDRHYMDADGAAGVQLTPAQAAAEDEADTEADAEHPVTYSLWGPVGALPAAAGVGDPAAHEQLLYGGELKGVDLRTSVTWLRQLAAAPCARLSELGQPLGPHAVAILRARELSAARSNLARFGEVGCLLRDALEEEQLATPRTEWAPPPAPSSARSLTVLALEHATAATAKVTRGSGAAGSSGKGAAGRRRAVVDEDGDGQGSSGSSGDEEDGLQDQPLGRRLRAKAQPRLRRLKQITKAGESSGGSETEDASEEAEIEEESSEGDGDEEEEGGAGGRAKRARQEGGEAARKRARLQSGSSAVPPAERKAVQVEVQYREYTDKVPPSRDTFRVMLQRWQGERAKEQPPPGHEPQLGGVSWDPYAVFRAVAARGGWRHVSAAGLWREVGLEAEPRLAGCAPRALSRALEHHYTAHLAGFEAFVSAKAPVSTRVVDKHLPDGSVVYEECDKAGTGWRSSSALNSGKGASPAKPAIASAKPKPKPAVVRPPPKVKALHPPAGKGSGRKGSWLDAFDDLQGSPEGKAHAATGAVKQQQPAHGGEGGNGGAKPAAAAGPARGSAPVARPPDPTLRRLVLHYPLGAVFLGVTPSLVATRVRKYSPTASKDDVRIDSMRRVISVDFKTSVEAAGIKSQLEMGTSARILLPELRLKPTDQVSIHLEHIYKPSATATAAPHTAGSRDVLVSVERPWRGVGPFGVGAGGYAGRPGSGGGAPQHSGPQAPKPGLQVPGMPAAGARPGLEQRDGARPVADRPDGHQSRLDKPKEAGAAGLAHDRERDRERERDRGPRERERDERSTREGRDMGRGQERSLGTRDDGERDRERDRRDRDRDRDRGRERDRDRGREDRDRDRERERDRDRERDGDRGRDVRMRGSTPPNHQPPPPPPPPPPMALDPRLAAQHKPSHAVVTVAPASDVQMDPRRAHESQPPPPPPLPAQPPPPAPGPQAPMQQPQPAPYQLPPGFGGTLPSSSQPPQQPLQAQPPAPSDAAAIAAMLSGLGPDMLSTLVQAVAQQVQNTAAPTGPPPPPPPGGPPSGPYQVQQPPHHFPMEPHAVQQAVPPPPPPPAPMQQQQQPPPPPPPPAGGPVAGAQHAGAGPDHTAALSTLLAVLGSAPALQQGARPSAPAPPPPAPHHQQQQALLQPQLQPQPLAQHQLPQQARQVVQQGPGGPPPPPPPPPPQLYTRPSAPPQQQALAMTPSQQALPPHAHPAQWGMHGPAAGYGQGAWPPHGAAGMQYPMQAQHQLHPQLQHRQAQAHGAPATADQLAAMLCQGPTGPVSQRN